MTERKNSFEGDSHISRGIQSLCKREKRGSPSMSVWGNISVNSTFENKISTGNSGKTAKNPTEQSTVTQPINYSKHL
jgi:hypothetical protein